MAVPIERFLASVERRAYRMAEIATGNRDEALDIVQDAMLALVRRYGERPAAEWGPLFQRILQSRISDWRRRRTVRRRVLVWLGRGEAEEDERGDPLEALPDPAGRGPDRELERERLGERLEAVLRRLPPRQQQAFLLRAWEGLDTAAAAAAMGCSEGSVKTHYSRAVATLRGHLEADHD
jgi:RNA polymerase sigma-70 factor (ECF subfamily)